MQTSTEIKKETKSIEKLSAAKGRPHFVTMWGQSIFPPQTLGGRLQQTHSLPLLQLSVKYTIVLSPPTNSHLWPSMTTEALPDIPLWIPGTWTVDKIKVALLSGSYLRLRGRLTKPGKRMYHWQWKQKMQNLQAIRKDKSATLLKSAPTG